MSAAEETEYRAMVADADFSNQGTSQYTFVCIGEAQNGKGYDQGNAACQPWTAGKRAYGILLNAPAQGEGATVRIRGGELVRCGAPWAAGDFLGEMAGGLAKPVSRAEARGVATNSAVVGDLGMIDLF